MFGSSSRCQEEPILVSAPAVDAFTASGCDETGFVDMAELRGRCRG
ncbi:hypothetical protein [Streptomyces virginiae]